ncbi:glycosyltransferase, group 2 family [Mycolicibacterium fortuitum subsp. acetamidolyticum]|uniref:Glycosyltransferase, group 2 family n=1 Tax=Mycolicibacterium fortuitum subsp. acetamidolyticum TaxID=144550 RepID=A0A100WX38_MYCFO|nr:glycosyltransferase, group 2 family [Mycolicibacterium fortuitum subsp. acetamidolyticum]
MVSLGRPEARTTRTASATAALTLPVSSPPVGLMLKATITGSIVRARDAVAVEQISAC